MTKYLVIEDDLETAQIIINALNSEGYTSTYAQNGFQALKILENDSFDFIILDLVMAGYSGLDLHQRIRHLKPNLPIVIVSGLSSTEERIEGLRAGCDDYIVKPFSQTELQVRIKNVLKFSRKQKEATTLIFGDLHLNRVSRKVLQKEKALTLAKMEFILLELFMQNPNKVISKEQILKDIFGLNFVPPTNIVDVLVCRLRAKLNSDNNTTAIVTVRSIGYALRANAFEYQKPQLLQTY